ncbi:MAG: transposase, partial [Proteobacteria bacterium]|nr:transposase [Pseudomonadota bacterium]
AGYLSNARKWDWLSKKLLLSMLSEKPAVAVKEYRKFIQGEETQEVLGFFGKKNLPSVFGTDTFVQWVKDEFFERNRHQEVPQSWQLAPSIPDIKETVCQSYGIPITALAKTVRGQANGPRNLAIYLCRKLSREKLEDICKEFDLGSYSSVSSAVIRTENLLANDNRLRKKFAEIRIKLSKGQAKT